MRNRSFIPWLVLSILLFGVIDLIVRGYLNTLFAILTYSATVGVPLGLSMGVLAAVIRAFVLLMYSATVRVPRGLLMGMIIVVIRSSVEFGIWILVGSVLGCVFTQLTLLSLASMFILAINIFKGDSARTYGSSKVDNEDVARVVGEGLLILGLIPVAVFGGAIGGWLYYTRHQHR